MTICRIILLALITIRSFSQEPYYELPSERNASNALNLPNLNSKQIFVYFGLNAGIKLGGLSNTGIQPANVKAKDDGFTTWEAFLGFNKNSRWQAEVAYSKYPAFINQELNLSKFGIYPVQLRSGKFFTNITLRGKKRILNLDRVAGRTGLFFTSGLLIDPFAKQTLIDEYNYEYYSGRVPPVDTLRVGVSFFQNRQVIKWENGLEISGRLSDQFEIGLYARVLMLKRGFLESITNIEYNNKSEVNYIKTGGINALIGFQLRYNFFKTVIYKSKI